MIKVGLVGLGNWGKKILPQLNQICELVSCSNYQDDKKRKWLKDNYPKVNHTFSYNDIINDSRIEAIVIATPIKTHLEIVRESLNAGKHVYVEKPLATTKEEVNELFALAKERCLNLFVGYIYLHNPILRRIENINKGDPIDFIHMQWDKFGSFNESIYWNLISHELSIVYKLFGSSLKSVEALNRFGGISHADITSIELGYNDNRNCTIVTNRLSSDNRKSVMLHTRSGNLYVWENDVLYSVGLKEGYKMIYKNDSNTLEVELRSFLDNIKSRQFIYETDLNYFITETLQTIQNISND